MFCESEDDDLDLQECDSDVEVELSDEDYVPSGPDSYVESESGDSDVQQQTLINVTATTGFRDSLSTPTVPTPPSTPKWSDNPTMKNIPFTKKQEFLVVPDGNQPMDFFNMLVDDSFFKLIVTETNRYAEEVFLSPGTAESSRITRWRDVTIEEMRVFFGVLLHMGTISTNRMQDYWKTSRFFSMPFFSSALSRDRFLLIMRCLHFVQNPKEGQPFLRDRLFKIRPLIDFFNEKIRQVYYPGKNLSLDESMVLWRGRLSFRQYIKNKRHKYGIKLYVLTEPDGTILNFDVYTGHLDDFGNKGHAANVVLHLLDERLDVGHSVYMDNYYKSHALAVKLLGRKTYCSGTLRTDRKNTPPEVKIAKLKKGETIVKYSDDGVLIGKWRDKRDVAYISTEFTNEMVAFQDKLGRDREKPKPIFHYNENMGGVDRQDQLLSYYPCEKKTLRWYKKLGVHVLQMLLINSYLLYRKFTKSKMTMYDFRLNIIDKLVPPKATLPMTPITKNTHNPKKNPQGPKGKAAISRRCTWCWNQIKRRRNTSYHCPACVGTPYLCIGDCFKNFHKNK